MDRRFPRYGYRVACLAIVLAVLATGGCRTAFQGLAYLIKGTDEAAEYPGLKAKKVAVVCRTLVALEYQDAGSTKELARQISSLLQQRVPKIQVIDQEKVAAWADEQTWDEFSEVGHAMHADMVVGVDLTGFSIFEGQTLYRGRASATIKVYDCVKKCVVFEKPLPPIVYPPNIAIPASDRQEYDFRREFTSVLADYIARYFYAHDPHADVAMDAAAGLR